MPTGKKKATPACSSAKSGQGQRPLIGSAQAAELMDLFKVLANDTRLRLLHALVRAGELCVGSLAEELGMTAQAVSNQLQRLADRGIVRHRRQGTNIYYCVVNDCVMDLLERGLCLVEKECREGPT